MSSSSRGTGGTPPEESTRDSSDIEGEGEVTGDESSNEQGRRNDVMEESGEVGGQCSSNSTNNMADADVSKKLKVGFFQPPRRKRKASKLNLRVKNKEKRRKLNANKTFGIDDDLFIASPDLDEDRMECFSDSSVEEDAHQDFSVQEPFLDFTSVSPQGLRVSPYVSPTTFQNRQPPSVPELPTGSEPSPDRSQDFEDTYHPPAFDSSTAMSFESISTIPDYFPEQKNVGTFCSSMEMNEFLLEQARKESKPIYTCLKIMKNYLALTVSYGWSVSVEDEILSISLISHVGQNSIPVVVKSILWKENRAHVYVRGKPLRYDHFIWSLPRPDIENHGSVCDYLTKLCHTLTVYKICDGISSHDHLWEESKEKGLIETTYSERPCFRTFMCSLLVPFGETSCKFCRLQASDFTRLHNRRVGYSMREKDQSKINDRYKQREELVQKVNELATQNKSLKQKNRRLALRLQKLIQRDSVDIESSISSDLQKICETNYRQMTPVQRIFWEQQQLAFQKRSSGAARTMRWHPVMVRLALKLRHVSQAAADLLHEEGILTLPSQRRLYDYSQFVEAKEGCQEELLNSFRKKMLNLCPNDEDRYFVLMFDEMHIRSNLVFSKRLGHLVGYINLPEYLQELQALEAESDIPDAPRNKPQKLAKKVLVYMVQGVTCGLQFVPAVYSTADLSASELFNRTWEVIFFMERFDAKIICVVCDGASTNRKFIKMNPNWGEEDFVHVTKNLASGSRVRPLFFMLDPPHLWKTFRNSLANSYAHRKSRTLWKNGQHLSWIVLQLLFKSQVSKFSDLKLTKAHIQLTSFSCMKVKLAVQIFSNSVVQGILSSRDPQLLQTDSAELCAFLSLMNRFIDVLNGGERSEKRQKNPDLDPYTDKFDPRFDFLLHEFLQYFDDWKQDVMERQGNYSKQQRSRMMISYQTIQAAKITVHSFVKMTRWLLENNVKSVSARVFNQDPLEQLFSVFRMKGGANNAPDLLQVLQYRVGFEAAGSTALSGSRRGNTEVLRRVAYDDCPLPVRRKAGNPNLDALSLEGYHFDCV